MLAQDKLSTAEPQFQLLIHYSHTVFKDRSKVCIGLPFNYQVLLNTDEFA